MDLFNQKDDIQLAFERFDADNPEVYAEIVSMAFRLKRAGRTRYGMHTILHVIRWHKDIVTRGEPFKINNNFSSRYARKLIEQYPEFDGFFATRALTAGR